MYGSVSDADTYFSTLRYDASSLWASATTQVKTALLNEATILIDRLNFKGCKTEEDQDNEFPRDEATEVPTDIEYATFEIAYSILSGRNIDYERENARKMSVSFGSGKNVRKTEQFVSENIENGIPSERAWDFLLPYLRDPTNIKLERQ